MAEVCVEGSAQGERIGAAVQGLVDRCVVVNRVSCQARYEFVYESSSLCRAESVAGTEAVILADCLVVIVFFPFRLAEERAEG